MRVEDLLQCVAPLGREAQPDARVVEPEDPGQDLRREPCGDRPAVWLAELGGELLAVGERYRRLELRVEQQAVLREEPREQQPVPLLVRALRDEQVAVVAQLAPLRAKPVAEGRLRRHRGVPDAGRRTRRGPRSQRATPPPPHDGQRAPTSRVAFGGGRAGRAWLASDDHGLAGVEMRLHARPQLVEVRGEIVAGLDGGGWRRHARRSSARASWRPAGGPGRGGWRRG